MNLTILIVTALPLEYDAVKSYLTEIKPVVHPDTSTIYNVGIFLEISKTAKIILLETGPGNISAAHETERALTFFKPDYLFFVGVAGGLKDVELGSVVVSSKVIGYETGKVDRTFKPRFEVAQASYQLEQIARQVKREGIWYNRIKDDSGKPICIVGPIAAGEKVIANKRSEIYKFLHQQCSEALAVEMEGIGFLQPIRAHFAHGIVIRGISDLINKKHSADGSGWQPKAARNAAAFAFEMISYLLHQNALLKKANLFNLSTTEGRKEIIDWLVYLYDQGPEQNSVWKRAGGNTSFLSNSASRKAQWFDAIEKLSNGGGGNITLDSLITEVKADYPTNERFQKQN